MEEVKKAAPELECAHCRTYVHQGEEKYVCTHCLPMLIHG